METPFFTVIIPTYNREELLREAIGSVLSQTFADFELIVVDDHSTDHTRHAVGSFKDDRIAYILNDRPRGGAGTRNAGIFRARGEWIAFLDDDDAWHSTKLASLRWKIAELDGTAGLIYTGYVAYDFKNDLEIDARLPKKEGWLQNDLLYKNYIGTFSAVAIRTDLLRKVNGLDEEFRAMQDMELYARISRLTKVAFIKESLSRVRLSNQDRITLSPDKKLESSILFWEKNRTFINRDIKLIHRAASRVFLFAMQKGDIRQILKSLPLTLLGLLVDIRNVYCIFREILSFFYGAISGGEKRQRSSGKDAEVYKKRSRRMKLKSSDTDQ
jgi:glycosyltransferase involved in cell wall biosynthesis